jgi:hypothetical protein
MSKIAQLVQQAIAGVGKTAFDRKPGTGALFAYADNDTGTIARVEGYFKLPNHMGGFSLKLTCSPREDGSISIIGEVEGQPRSKVFGILQPHTYTKTKAELAEAEAGLTDDVDDLNPQYKKGHITVEGPSGKQLTVKVNSKIKVSKTSGDPYRFMWAHHDQTRVAF